MPIDAICSSGRENKNDKTTDYTLTAMGKNGQLYVYYINSKASNQDTLVIKTEDPPKQYNWSGYSYKDSVILMTLSPNEELLAFNNTSGSLEIYDLDKRKFIDTPYLSTIEIISFLTNNHLIIKNKRGVIRLFSLANDEGAELCSIDNGKTIDVSKDGKKLLTTGPDDEECWPFISIDTFSNRTTIYPHLFSPRQIITIGNPKFTSDGRKVFSLCNNQFHLWDIEDKHRIGSLSFSKREVDDFFVEGNYLITNYDSCNCTIMDANSFEEKNAIDNSMAKGASAIKDLLLTCNPDYLSIRKLSTGKETQRIHKGNITNCKLSPKGNYIASCDSNGVISIWSLASNKEIASFQGREYPSFIFSQSEKLFAYTTEDKFVIWDLTRNQECLMLPGVFGQVFTPFFSPDDKYIIGDPQVKKFVHDIKLYKVSDGNEQKCLASNISNARTAFNTNSSKMAFFHQSYQSDSISLQILSTEDWNVEGSYSRRDQNMFMTNLEFSSDNTKLLAADAYQGKLFLWDFSTDKNLKSFETYRSLSPVDAIFSPDEKSWAVKMNDQTIQIWDSIRIANSRRGSEIKYHIQSVLNTDQKNLMSYYFSPDGEKMLTIGGGYYLQPNTIPIELWSTKTGKILQSWNFHSRSRNPHASFSNNGQRIFVNTDSVLYILNSRSGDIIDSIKNFKSYYDIVFSPSGKYFAFASIDSIHIWNAYNFEKVKSFRYYYTENILGYIKEKYFKLQSLTFSPNEKYLLLFGSAALIYDWRSGLLVDELDAQGKATFTKDGKKIVVSTTKSVKVFDFLPINELIEETRKRFRGRKLTPEERKKYHFDEYEFLLK